MRKIALFFVMIFLICCMTACENKGTVQEPSSITNTKNTSNTESSNVETTVEETKPSYNLIDKSREDLSDSEKKQLKYYNDGYTFIAQLSYDQKWLDFIVDSRNGNKPWLGYDYVEGGVADDRVITTIEDYINGDISMEFALKRLSEHQPNNQICILPQSLIDKCLQYIKSEPLNEFARKEVEHA